MSPQPAAEPTPAKRLSLSQVLELVLSKGTGERSSVTLIRNAKGETQIDVVVRTTDTGDVTTVEEASRAAQAVYDQLRAKYPLASGYVGATSKVPGAGE